jgi:hypothetical protein
MNTKEIADKTEAEVIAEKLASICVLATVLMAGGGCFIWGIGGGLLCVGIAVFSSLLIGLLSFMAMQSEK